MAEEKVKGIIVKLIDYKDADKLASIFTLEQGVITAKFTGVKKDKAKFKSVAQPFTFAEFNINKKANNKTITSAEIVDSFPLLTQNYNKTICAYIVLDMIKSILPIEKPEQDLFLLTVSALKNIEENNEYVSTIDYILKFISFSGMGQVFLNTDYVYLDNITGDFVSSHTINSMQIDKKVYLTLKAVANNQPIDTNENVLKQCLRLLHNIIYIKFNEDIKSFQFI